MHVQTPLLVVGAQRSGTTFVARMLAAHDDIFLTLNGKLLYYLITWVAQSGDGNAGAHLRLDEIAFSLCRKPVGNLPPPQLEAMVQRLVSAFPPDRFRGMEGAAIAREIWLQSYQPLICDRPVYGDKYNEYLLQLPAIGRILPDCRYVFVHREPTAVAVSMLRAFRGRPWVPVDVADAVAKWTDWNLRWLTWRDSVDPQRRIEIAYADVCATPAATFRRVCDFLSLPCASRYLDFVRHETRPSRAVAAVPVSSNELGRYAETYAFVREQLGYGRSPGV